LWLSFSFVEQPDQNIRYTDSDAESECNELSTKRKDKEIDKEKADT